jgi:serine/threonine protein kinase
VIDDGVSGPDADRIARALASLYRIERAAAATALGPTFDAATVDGTPARLQVVDARIVARMRDPHAFVRQLEQAGRVRHPGLAPLLGAGLTQEGVLYFGTVPAAGRSARERLAAGTMDAAEVATVGASAADALAAAHASGVRYGAVTPDALRLTRDGTRLETPALGAALRAAGLDPEEAAALLDAAQYASPEFLSGAPLDAASDVYSLGATLFALLTGKPPYGGRATATMLATVLADDAPRGARAGSSVVAAVLRAVEKRPEDRWPSAAAFGAALRPRAGRPAGCLGRAGAVSAVAAAAALIGFAGYALLVG